MSALLGILSQVQQPVPSFCGPPPEVRWPQEQPIGRRKPPRPVGAFENIYSQKLGREVPSASPIKCLEDAYVIENRLDVAAFIEKNRLRGLLLQARNPLNAAFGEAAIKSLTLVTDDEGFKTLFCLVMVPGDLEEARRALRSFDQQWWLARSELASGKLNFDFELV